MMNNEIKSIMLIDDDQDDRFFFATALEQVNEQVKLYTAMNGVDALDKLSFVKPDLILLDLVMPRMNGVVFLNMMKRKKELCNIPVIIYTTDLSIFQEQELLKTGAEKIIIKPQTFGDTVNRINEILQQETYRASA